MIYDEILAIANGAPCSVPDHGVEPQPGYETLESAISSIAEAFAIYIGLNKIDARWGYIHTALTGPQERPEFTRTDNAVSACVGILLKNEKSAASYTATFHIQAEYHNSKRVHITVIASDNVYIVDSTEPRLDSLLSGVADDIKLTAAGFYKKMTSR